MIYAFILCNFQCTIQICYSHSEDKIDKRQLINPSLHQLLNDWLTQLTSLTSTWKMSVFVLNGIYSGLRNFAFAFECLRIQQALSKFFALASYARCHSLHSTEKFPRKEVIQPHLPVRLPCYDFTPVTNPALGRCLQKVSSRTSGVVDFHGVTGGVYKTRERIQRSVLICVY